MDRPLPRVPFARSPRSHALLLAALLLAAPVLACSPASDPGSPEAAEPAATAAAENGELVWELPDGWNEVPPANRMRLAQASIPGAGGPADLVLFHFGPGQGGDARSNIERWLGQVEIEGEPEEGSFQSGDLTVSWVDVAGTLKPGQMGVGPSEPVPGSRLLGAVVEGPGGPWFLKATGPADTLTGAREDFLAMLRAARVE